MELDARRLYLREGCSSLFTYCTRVLHLAEGSAYNRIEVARAAREFPGILDALEKGALSLTAVRLLSPHLATGNHAAVLVAARHKSKREVEMLIAAAAHELVSGTSWRAVRYRLARSVPATGGRRASSR